MNAGAWFLIAAVLAAMICAIVGIVRIASALKRVRAHAKTIVPETLIAKALMAEDAARRMQVSTTSIEALLPRLGAALNQSAFALRELRSAFSLRR